MAQPPLSAPPAPIAPSGDSNIFDTVKDLVINAPGTIMEKVQSGDPIFIIGLCFIGIIAIYLLYFYGSKMYRSINSFRNAAN